MRAMEEPLRRNPHVQTIAYIEASTRSEPERAKLAGVCRYARNRGWNIQILYRHDVRPDVAAILREYRPVGVVVEASDGEDHVPPALFGRTPVVYLDPSAGAYGGKVSAVRITDGRTAELAVREFLSLGLRSVAYVGEFICSSWSETRRMEFVAAAKRAGLECAAFVSGRGEGDQVAYERDLGEWMRTLAPGTGIFAANDRTASCVLSCCRRLGLAVPAEFAVLGVDNDANRCENESPKLSSIQIDFENAGYLAGELLDRLLAAGGGRRRPRLTAEFGPLGVIRRESTNAFPRMSPRISAAMRLIREKACVGLRARDVAATVGGSRRLAEIRFREATGKTILEAIQEARLDMACTLLANTVKPVSLVATLCGYQSVTALGTVFRRRFGLTMLKWRKAHRPGASPANISQMSEK